MKVLHVINTLATGGAEVHLLRLCRELRRLGVTNVVSFLKGTVRGSRSLAEDFAREGIGLFDLSAPGRFDVGAVRRLLVATRRERPDLLHTHLPRADACGFAVHLVMGTPWVCSVHDIYSRSWSGWRTVPLFAWMWRRANAVIAISGAVREWLLTEHGLDPARVRTIHYGIERPTSPANDSAPRPRGYVIGTMGRLEPRKGHGTLIDAMPRVLREFPEARLVIAGHDPFGHGATLAARIEGLGLECSVELVGFRADVAGFLGSLDVFAFASESEGFGQVVVEAMAAGKPVVARRIPPLTEIVEDGCSGLLVPSGTPAEFADALIRLLHAPDVATAMGARGRGVVAERFSAATMAARTLELYETVVHRQRAAGA